MTAFEVFGIIAIAFVIVGVPNIIVILMKILDIVEDINARQLVEMPDVPGHDERPANQP